MHKAGTGYGKEAARNVAACGVSIEGGRKDPGGQRWVYVEGREASMEIERREFPGSLKKNGPAAIAPVTSSTCLWCDVDALCDT